MSRDATVTLDWADGSYKFKLTIGGLRELQEKCDAGPQTIYSRLCDGSWRIDDVREPIRIALIGGGLKPVEALGLQKRYIDDRPWLENVMTAQAIMAAALIGHEDEPLGKPEEAVETVSSLSQEENSASPPSMEPVQSLASQPETLMN
jgi:hypothetical protein